MPLPSWPAHRTGRGARRGRWPAHGWSVASARPGAAGPPSSSPSTSRWAWAFSVVALRHQADARVARRRAVRRTGRGRLRAGRAALARRRPVRRPGRRSPTPAPRSTSRPRRVAASPDGADDADVAAAVTVYQRAAAAARAALTGARRPTPRTLWSPMCSGGERPAARRRGRRRRAAPRGQRRRRPGRRLRDAVHDGLRRGHGRSAVPPVRGRPPVRGGGRRGGHGARARRASRRWCTTPRT